MEQGLGVPGGADLLVGEVVRGDAVALGRGVAPDSVVDPVADRCAAPGGLVLLLADDKREVAVLVDDPNRLDARHGVRVVGEGELDGGGSDCAEGEGEGGALHGGWRWEV